MAYMSIPGSGSGSGSASGSSSNSGFQFSNSPFGDTTYTKVFVGGLAWETQSVSLHRYFERYGDILEAVVITDKNTGRSKGYGFVTFRDPESARRACADPNPVIDGRRANCNLASLGRPRAPSSYAWLRLRAPFVESSQVPHGSYVGSSGYHQPVPYSYQQGFGHPSYGYTAYGSEYVYPQGVYNPYMAQQYLQMYGVPGTVNQAIYSIGQFGHSLPGSHGYPMGQGYAMPGHHVVQYSGPRINGLSNSPMAAIQASYPAGVAAPLLSQPQFMVPAHSPKVTQGSGSDQMAG